MKVGQPKEWTCDCSSKLKVCEKRLSKEDSVLHFFVPIKAVIARPLRLIYLMIRSAFSAQCNEVMNFLSRISILCRCSSLNILDCSVKNLWLYPMPIMVLSTQLHYDFDTKKKEREFSSKA